MALVKFRQKSDLTPWDFMDRLTRSFFNTDDWLDFGGNWAPAVDISENDDEIIVRAEVPGIKKDDIKLTVHDGILTISGEKKQEKIDKEENFYRTERVFGSFSRSFSLPSTVKADKVKAKYKDGILSISLPKVEEAKPKEIAIEAE